MSPTVTILMLISAWLTVAGAMLWGVLRVSRRHHHPVTRPQLKARPQREPRHQVAHLH
ncbi:hypothetical protein [Pseudomonas sp. MWU16-30317]|uniref:hypothetical protein n=1 Tax=Pseudomonas sp. MWU16-30317 TaxID=2878095 RepID=UPI001CF9B9CF|nr:hypothetical protein [Pseudomonas sp. MWU16-30317]